MVTEPAPPPTAESALPLAKRAARLVRERFPLEIHGVSILVFFVTNSAVAQVSTAPEGTPIRFGPRSLLVLLAIGLMFLRMRLFDEVKDLGHDRAHNPTRPLPRGLMTDREVNLWAAATAVAEGAIAAALGLGAFTGYLAVLAFTLLMRFEFFMRDAIRPRLFTYAFIHTPSGGLIGLFVYCAVTGRAVWDVTRPMWFYAFAGWSLLMVFEVARKTYDPKTEPGPDTYSSVFGVKGAAALNALFIVASTILILLTALDALHSRAQVFALLLWGVTGIALAVNFRYLLIPSRDTAGHVRLVAQLYLVLASLFLAGQLFLARGAALSAGA